MNNPSIEISKNCLVLFLLVMVLGCTSTPNVQELYKLNTGKGWITDVNPSQLVNYVTWEEAIDLVASRKVESVVQGHNLVVSFFLKNGDVYSTIEPDIDTVFAVIDRCGKRCAKIQLITE